MSEGKRCYYVNLYRKGDDLMVADNMITHRTPDAALKARKKNFADGYYGTAVLEVGTIAEGEEFAVNECGIKLISFAPKKNEKGNNC